MSASFLRSLCTRGGAPKFLDEFTTRTASPPPCEHFSPIFWVRMSGMAVRRPISNSEEVSYLVRKVSNKLEAR
jgi:hypothetical protein